MRKIKVAFIYKTSNPFMSGKHFDNTEYNFHVSSLQRNNDIDVSYFHSEDKLDTSVLKDRFDIILLLINEVDGMPELVGIDDLDIPTICGVCDAFGAKKSIELHKKWKIDYYFDFQHEGFFYDRYPKHFKYKKIMLGLETRLYNNLKPFNQRIKDKILLTGAIGNKKFFSKIINDIKRPKWNAYRFYNLRIKCSSLPYVDYTPTLQHNYVNDRYPQLLEQYASSIVAATYVPSIKYWENAAAGCLTFMEISKLNKGHFLGYRDNESCIFIDQKNYKEKFEEYLSDTKNPKWKEIANAGREFTLQNYTNDKAVDSLVELMRTLI